MYCPNCGKENKEKNKFCYNCGQRMPDFQEAGLSHQAYTPTYTKPVKKPNPL